MKHSRLKWLVLVALITISLTACSTSSGILPVDNARTITSGESFGQSFTAVNRGLSGVSALLAPVEAQGKGSLLFHLKDNLQSTDDIARARLPIAEITRKAYYKFDIPPQPDSQRKDYFLQVEVEEGGQVTIFTAPGGSYLDGALYTNLEPQDAQLGFLLGYDRQSYFLGLAQTFLGWLPVLLIGVILFVLPGWGIFGLLWQGWEKLNWGEKLGLSAGISLATYPLLMLWTNLVGLHLGFGYAVLPPLVGLIALLWKNWRSIANLPDRIRRREPLITKHHSAPFGTVLANTALVIVLVMVIVSRLWVIRSVDIPLFGDSYQHTMISQLISDHGGLFDSWQPYADLVTFTYHFGFHSAVAVYHWISGVTVEKAVLWTGQLINIIAILSLYPLATKITKNRWAGVMAVVIAGLLSPMPSYYANWGRYTQLAGQAILPVVIWIAWSILERPLPVALNISTGRRLISWTNLALDPGALIMAWLALGGLALSHYRVLLIAVLFFPAYGLFSLTRKHFVAWLGRTGWMGVGGMILFLPWFIHVFGGKIMKMVTAELTITPSKLSTATQAINSIGDIRTYLPIFIWIIFLACVAWGLWLRRKELAIFTVWWLIIVIVSNPASLHLPGTGVITNFAMLIAFYIPAGVVIGAVLSGLRQGTQTDEPAEGSGQRINRVNVVNSVVFAVICFVGIWGLPQRMKELDPLSFALVTRPDLRAMTWIDDNLPADADFLVNSFFAYNNAVVVGSDGGWWIPLLAGRQTSLPPITYGFEMGEGTATTQAANSFWRSIQEQGINSPETIQLLRQKGIDYVYIGQRQGSVNYSGPQVLDPEIIMTLASFKPVYHQDRVWIFEVLP